jgi:hypothetical protein
MHGSVIHERGEIMRSRESCIQKLNELSIYEQSIDPNSSEWNKRWLTRAQMKGILFAVNHAQYDSFSITGNQKFVDEG